MEAPTGPSVVMQPMAKSSDRFNAGRVDGLGMRFWAAAWPELGRACYSAWQACDYGVRVCSFCNSGVQKPYPPFRGSCVRSFADCGPRTILLPAHCLRAGKGGATLPWRGFFIDVGLGLSTSLGPFRSLRLLAMHVSCAFVFGLALR